MSDEFCNQGSTIVVAPAATEILAGSRTRGIVYEAASTRRSFRAVVYADVVTKTKRCVSHTFYIRASGGLQDRHETSQCLNRAWMYLTHGRPNEMNLVKGDVQWEGGAPWPRVAEFQEHILGYNKEHNLFLVSNAFLDGRTAQSSRKRQQRAQSADDIDVSDCQDDAPEEVSLAAWVTMIRQIICCMLLCAPAGHGKSYLHVHVLKPALEQLYNKTQVWITGSTNLSAQAVGGATIHSQSGLQLGRGDMSTLLSKMHGCVIERGKKVKAIVIEECSMLTGAFLDLLDQVLRKHQDALKPFGGVRMFLLAPVPDLQAMPEAAGGPKYRKAKAKYLFQWLSAKFKCFTLKHSHRYSKEGRLGQLVSRLRLAPKLTKDMVDEIQALLLNGGVDLDVRKSTVLSCKKREARKYSNERAAELKDAFRQDEEEVCYFAVDRQGQYGVPIFNTLDNEDDDLKDIKCEDDRLYYDEEQRCRSLLSSMPSPNVVRLRKRAVVFNTADHLWHPCSMTRVLGNHRI
ncbi:TPA: A helicase nuclease that prepares dsDNA breaks (DSB) for recombinational DNA repair [Trebouxia sp. C0004]